MDYHDRRHSEEGLRVKAAPKDIKACVDYILVVIFYIFIESISVYF